MSDISYKKFFDLENIIADIRAYLPNFDEKKFRKAFNFAEKAHRGQTRKDGKTPYLIHPVEALKILVSYRADEDILISALLHDVPEDTKYEIEDVKKEFGENVAFLVDGITKLSKVHYRHNMTERTIESLKKMFLHTAKDPRVILIKLADRLHNMRTLGNVTNPEKRVRIAKETLEIFVPVANLLGINELKTEMEDLCFMYLFPTEHKKLEHKVKDSNKRNKKTLTKFIKTLQTELDKNGIKATISERNKGLYRAYKRICSIGKTVETLRDRLAITIIVDDVPKCYQTLGIVHSLFIPKLNRFKDYIANPKINGYQSLHTVVFGMEGIPTEIQIQTEKMNVESRYGVAAHYFYGKSSPDAKDSFFKDFKKSSWINKILELEKEHIPSGDFMDDLKLDILSDRIFVFTPKGESIDLPRGATVIDFAYAIHTDLGNHADKAEINGEIAPIITVLKTGDVVNVDMNSENFPELYWLSFVKTNLARNKVLAYLKKKSRQKKLKEGRQLLQKEFDILGLGVCEDLNFKKLRDYLNHTLRRHFQNLNDIFVSIGGGQIRATDVAKACRDGKKNGKILKAFVKDRPKEKIVVDIEIQAKNRFGVLKDVSSMIYKYADDMSKLTATTDKEKKKAIFQVQVVVDDLEKISHIFEELEQFDDVSSVYRMSKTRFIWALLLVGIALTAWGFHPSGFVGFLNKHGLHERFPLISDSILLVGGIVLIISLYYVTRLLKRNLLFFRNRVSMWFLTFIAVVSPIAVVYYARKDFVFTYMWQATLGILIAIFLFFVVRSFIKFRYE